MRSRYVEALRNVGSVFVWLLLPSTAWAGPKVDTVRLKNGDRLTCEIKKLQQGVLTVSTDPLDSVAVHWAEVASVESPSEFEVTLESGVRHYGTLTATAVLGELVVVESGVPSPPFSLSVVTALVPIGASIWSRMDGNIDLGFTFAQANTETHFTLNAGATYRSPKFRLSSLIASQLTTRQDAERTLRNSLSLNGSRLYDSLWFATILGQIQQNEELQLDLRTVAGGGVGRVLWQSNYKSIALYSGLVYTREHFVDQPIDNSAEAALGAEVDFFSPKQGLFTLTNSILTYYDVTGRNRMRLELQSAWQHKFLSDFYWSLNAIESFDSDPPDTQKQNDFSLSLSLGWKF